jgi:dnd system-associated protein 4
MRAYRVRRPKEYDDLLNLLRDKEQGVFATFKSALVFAAAVGFKERLRVPFSETGEPIALSLFSEHQDQPFIFCLALTEYNDVSYLREENFLEAMLVFEEYAAGGLSHLHGILDTAHIKESIEAYLVGGENQGLISVLSEW